MPRDPNSNRKSRVTKRNRYGTSAVKKAAIKKANEASVRARELRREQEMRKNEPAQDLITPNEVINTELGTPYELRNRVQETGIEPENDRVEQVEDLVETNVGTENDRVEPVREANEEIVHEPETTPENVVANEGAESFKVPPILDIEVSIERS
jgi:hypothetical protein